MIARIVHPNATRTVPAAKTEIVIESGALSTTGPTVAVSVDVTAIDATSVGVAVSWSPDGAHFGPADPGEDDLVDALTAITSTGVLSQSFVSKAPFYQLTYTVTGAAGKFATFTVATLS